MDPNPATGQREKSDEDILVDSFFPPVPFDDPKALAEREEPRTRKAQELLDKDPSLPYITAIIMAGDLVSAERSDKMLEAGVSFQRALHFVGSYGRVDFALRAQDRGYCTEEELFEILPELWAFSDPDDTDVRFLTMWHKAWLHNKRRPITDGRPLPGAVLRIYRGQDAFDDDTFGRDPDRLPVGIAWSLDKSVAEKFAHGAALRVRNRPNPAIIVAKVKRKHVYAYLTARGESEVIVNPFDVMATDVEV